MGTMYDSVTGLACPYNAEIVAGYVDGQYGPNDPYGSGWSVAAWAHYPNAYHVTITVEGTPGARVADVESGAMTPQGAASWAKDEVDAGRRPTIYASEWDWYNEVDPALAAVGLSRPAQVDGWMAWIGHTEIPAGFVAIQYIQDAKGNGGANIDVSNTNGVWPQNVPTPSPTPPPAPTGETMPVSPVVSFKPNQLDTFQISGGTLWHKWFDGSGWDNEPVAGPNGGASGKTVTLVDAVPQVSIEAGQIFVTAEDTADGHAWVFNQAVEGEGSDTWAAGELP